MAARKQYAKKPKKSRAQKLAAQRKNEKQLAAPRRKDGVTPPAIHRTEPREMLDLDLHRRIGPAVPVPDDDWY